MTVINENNGKEVNFQVVNNKHLKMLDSNDKRSEIMDILIEDNGEITTKFNESIRTPHDAAKCLVECSKGCNGDLICVAKCAATCSTIII